MSRFVVKAPFSPTGDQPQAIEALSLGVIADTLSKHCLA